MAKGWRYLLPTWVLHMAGGLEPLQQSFERNAERGDLQPGCIGFEIVADDGVPHDRHQIYTCVRFRGESDL